jgi:hypothetical protein
LDCDQVVPVDYLIAVAQKFHAHSTVPGLCLKCKGCDGALTGRLGYRLQDFLDIGGYDEDGPPSSGQDVDVRNRLHWLGEQRGKTLVQCDIAISGEDICGGALPNDFDNTARKHDRGWAKVCNVDPAYLKKLGSDPTKYWQSMQSSGWSNYYQPLKMKKQILRNQSTAGKKICIGSWWLIVKRTIRTNPLLEGFGAAGPVAAAANPGMATASGFDRIVSNGSCSLGSSSENIGVEIIVVGAAELHYKTHTNLSCLCRLVLHVLCEWCENRVRPVTAR